MERNLGRYDVPESLRQAGANVVVHHDVLPPDSPDEDWIRLCGEQGYLAITEDKRIRYRQFELEAIREYQAAVIVLRAKLLTGAQKGEILAKALNRIERFFSRHDPPFVAGLDRSGRLSKYDL